MNNDILSLQKKNTETDLNTNYLPKCVDFFKYYKFSIYVHTSCNRTDHKMVTNLRDYRT